MNHSININITLIGKIVISIVNIYRLILVCSHRVLNHSNRVLNRSKGVLDRSKGVLNYSKGVFDCSKGVLNCSHRVLDCSKGVLSGISRTINNQQILSVKYKINN